MARAMVTSQRLDLRRRPAAGASLGAGSELSDLRPIGRRRKETSRRVSRSSRRFAGLAKSHRCRHVLAYQFNSG